MTKETAAKIRHIIRMQYGCDDTFTPESRLTGSIILGDSLDTLEFAYALDDEFDGEFSDTDYTKWQTVQDVFDSVEAATNGK